MYQSSIRTYVNSAIQSPKVAPPENGSVPLYSRGLPMPSSVANPTVPDVSQQTASSNSPPRHPCCDPLVDQKVSCWPVPLSAIVIQETTSGIGVSRLRLHTSDLQKRMVPYPAAESQIRTSQESGNDHHQHTQCLNISSYIKPPSPQGISGAHCSN